MKRKTAQRIREIWDEIESIEPDISTERLTMMTVDRANLEFGADWDAGDISNAMIDTADKEMSIER